MSEQIEAGEGWRLIDKEKCIPEEGDEVWCSCTDKWMPIFKGDYFCDGDTYRRRMPAKPEWFSGKSISTYESGPFWLMETYEEKTLLDPNESREFAAWLVRYAEWREAQGEG
jgi:hypothetical protein